MASTFIVVPLVILVLLGWLVPLIFGIVRSRRNKGGVGCIVLGGVWGFLALCLFGLICVSWFTFSRVRGTWEPQDFDPAAYAGALGRVETTHDGDGTLALRGDAMDNAHLRLSMTNGVTIAPAGVFSVQSYEIQKKDSTGTPWEASCYNPSGKSGKVTVPTNGVATLSLGAPFEARVKTRVKSDGTRSFDLKITGCSHNNFRIFSRGKGRQAPGFEVVNTDGQVVWTGKFAYG